MPGRDPYRGILAGPVDGPARLATVYPDVDATPGLRVEHRPSRVRGRVLRIEGNAVVVRTEIGTDRLLTLTPGGFAVDGRAVTLVRPRTAPPDRIARTPSGSVVAPPQRARVARSSRIWVEGVHDAELVERVWGDDLRVEGIVVERLDGIDHLPQAIAEFDPTPQARLGVLVDHLVAGSKEERLARSVAQPHVLVTGTPFVDVWQAIRPQAAGIAAWPVVPPGRPWKQGVCQALGEPDAARLWRRLLGAVRSYADLEAELVGAVERLVDFVTEPAGAP